ncbi:bacteriocin immunity protein [Streptococcus merionis]|uniref:bacteriocin immunity protein n=1 Tax=Streptococcus merionis TaxID=400065 RepID=UPI0035130EE9
MTGLKWFSGGTDRRKEALTILEDFIQIMGDKPNLISLEMVLISYMKELEDPSESVPYILSRMNIEISRVVIERQLHLSDEQSNQIAKLRKLSNIRYGY